MADTAVGVRNPRKRRITEKRRQQGREAQRRYRDKQRVSQINVGAPKMTTGPGIGIEEPAEFLAYPSGDDTLDQIFASSTDIQSSIWAATPGNSSLETLLGPESLATEHTMLSNGQNANTVSQPITGSTLQIPMDTYVRVQRYSFYAACVANAAVLGISLTQIQESRCGDSMLSSPWTDDASKGRMRELASAPDLIAGESQRRYDHGLYIDCLPFKEFREKLLALRSAGPEVFDEDDFIQDLDARDAFQCWGPTPWENRSWEVQPRFLQKWWMITGGENGEMATSSRWWRRFRGED